MLVGPLATLVCVSVRAGIEVRGIVNVIPHETNVDLVYGRLLLNLLVDYIEILVVVCGRGLAAGVGVMVVPCCGRVIVVHLLLSRLVRLLGEVFAE